MAQPLYRAWRFVHPDFDFAQLHSGLRVSSTGGIEIVEGEAAVRQSILLLLTTRPGERVMRPTYGCNLQRLLFAPNDTTTHGLAIHYVREALNRWEPRIDLVRLDATCNAQDPGRMDIVLEYRVRRTARHETLALSMSLTEEAP